MGRSGIILGLVIGSMVSLEGVAQEIDDAAALLRAAAEQGDASAQYNLGLMYLEGQGVKQDNVEAYAWIRTAAAQGKSGTLEIRQALLREMTTSQENRAIELAREYREKYVTR
jgi:TPR repeat protein